MALFVKLVLILFDCKKYDVNGCPIMFAIDNKLKRVRGSKIFIIDFIVLLNICNAQGTQNAATLHILSFISQFSTQYFSYICFR